MICIYTVVSSVNRGYRIFAYIIALVPTERAMHLHNVIPLATGIVLNLKSTKLRSAVSTNRAYIGPTMIYRM